jgi:hypothetical protein
VQVMITVLINGGSTHYLLKRWKLQGNDEQHSSFEMLPMLHHRVSNASVHTASHADHIFQPDTPPTSSAGAFSAVQVKPRCVQSNLFDPQLVNPKIR